MRRFFVTLALIAIVLAPFGVSASGNDRQIAEQIVRGLKHRQDSGDLQGFNIDLQVDKGSVWLKGHVSDPEQERLALEVARRVEGVQRVFNQIEVQGLEKTESPVETAKPAPTATRPTQEQVVSNRRAKQAKPAVAKEPVADESTQEGLQLVSTVREETEADRQEAQQIAQELVKKLRAEQEEGNLERFGIDIEVDKGILWLKGQMASKEQRHIVLEIARRISGVKQVVNDLSIDDRHSKEVAVSPAPELEYEAREVEKDLEVTPAELPATDEDDSETLANEIISRLQTAKSLGTLKDFGVDVQIDEGVVWMSGYVANESQQTVILDIASHVAGVKQVVNDLSIVKREEVQGSPKYPETLASHPIPVQMPNEPATLPTREPAQVEANPLRGLAPQALAAPQAVGQGIAAPQAIGQGVAAPQGMAAAAPAPGTYVPAQGTGRVIGYRLIRIDNPQLQQQPTFQPVSNQLQTPMAFAPARPVQYAQPMQGQPQPMMGAGGVGVAPARYDHPQLPGYAWPSYAAHPNYGAVTYPRQYSAQAWPYIGPFYPYPQVPLGWRKVTLEWDDGWWQLDFKDRH